MLDRYKVKQTGEIKQTVWETVYAKTAKHLPRAATGQSLEALVVTVSESSVWSAANGQMIRTWSAREFVCRFFWSQQRAAEPPPLPMCRRIQVDSNQ